jgi:hypothetical protein
MVAFRRPGIHAWVDNDIDLISSDGLKTKSLLTGGFEIFSLFLSQA